MNPSGTITKDQEVQTTDAGYLLEVDDQCQEDMQNSTTNAVFYKCGFCEKLFESKEKYTQHIRDAHMLHIFCCKKKEVNFFNFPSQSQDINDMKSVETQTLLSRIKIDKVNDQPHPDGPIHSHIFEPTTSGVKRQRSLLKSKNIIQDANLNRAEVKESFCSLTSTSNLSNEEENISISSNASNAEFVTAEESTISFGTNEKSSNTANTEKSSNILIAADTSSNISLAPDISSSISLAVDTSSNISLAADTSSNISSIRDNNSRTLVTTDRNKETPKEARLALPKENLQDIVQIHSFVGAYQVVCSLPETNNLTNINEGAELETHAEEHEGSDDLSHELDILPACFLNIPDHAYYAKTIYCMPADLSATYFKKRRKSPKKRKQYSHGRTEPEEIEPINAEVEETPENTNKGIESLTRKMSEKTVKILPSLTDDPSDQCTSEIAFSCDYCNKSFLTCKLLLRHVTKIHTNQHYNISCAKCNEKFSSLNKMQHHVRARSHYIGWYCYPCRKRFYKLEDFWKHGCKYKNSKSFVYIDMKKFYNKERAIWQCDICKELFFAKKVLQNHISKCCLLCDSCDFAFYEAMSYINHKARCKIALRKEKAIEKSAKGTLQSECLIHCKYCTQSFSPEEIDNFVTHVENCPLKRNDDQGIKIKKKSGRKKKLDRMMVRSESNSDNSEIAEDNLAREFEMDLDNAEFVEEVFRTNAGSNDDPTIEFFRSLNIQPSIQSGSYKIRKLSTPKVIKSINVRDKLVLSPELQPSCSVEKLHLIGIDAPPKSLKNSKYPGPGLKIVDVRSSAEFFNYESDNSPETSENNFNLELSKSTPGSAKRSLWPRSNSEFENDNSSVENEISRSENEDEAESESIFQPQTAETSLPDTAAPVPSIESLACTQVAVKTTPEQVDSTQPTSSNFVSKMYTKPGKMVLKTRKGKLINCFFRPKENFVCCTVCGHWVKDKRITTHPCKWIRRYLSSCFVKLTDISKMVTRKVESPQKEVSPEMEIIQNVSKAYSSSNSEECDDNQVISISKEINAGDAYARLVSLRKHVRKSYAELPEVIDKIEAQLPENFTYTYVAVDNVEEGNGVLDQEASNKRNRVKFAEWKKKWALKKPKTRRRFAVKKKAIQTANLKLKQNEEDESKDKKNEDEVEDSCKPALEEPKTHCQRSLFIEIRKSLNLENTEDVEVEQLTTDTPEDIAKEKQEEIVPSGPCKRIVPKRKIVRKESIQSNEGVQKGAQTVPSGPRKKIVPKRKIVRKESIQLNEGVQKGAQTVPSGPRKKIVPKRKIVRKESIQSNEGAQTVPIYVNENKQQEVTERNKTDSEGISLFLSRKDYTRKRKSISQPIEGNKEEVKNSTPPVAKRPNLDDQKQSEEKEVSKADSNENTRSMRHKTQLKYYFGKRTYKSHNLDQEKVKQLNVSTESKQKKVDASEMVKVDRKPTAKVKPMMTRSHTSPANAGKKREKICTTDIENQKVKKQNCREKKMPTDDLNEILESLRENYTCCVCATMFDDDESYRNHTRDHAGTHPYYCNMCGKCFNQLVTLTLHIQNAKRLAVRTCDACAFQFCTKVQVDNHMKLHK